MADSESIWIKRNTFSLGDYRATKSTVWVLTPKSEQNIPRIPDSEVTYIPGSDLPFPTPQLSSPGDVLLASKGFLVAGYIDGIWKLYTRPPHLSRNGEVWKLSDKRFVTMFVESKGRRIKYFLDEPVGDTSYWVVYNTMQSRVKRGQKKGLIDC
jgi:hypothetical protein